MCLKTVNTKSFIANKINIIAKAPVRYSYDSFARAKLIHNIREGARTLQLRFICTGESGEINLQQSALYPLCFDKMRAQYTVCIMTKSMSKYRKFWLNKCVYP